MYFRKRCPFKNYNFLYIAAHRPVQLTKKDLPGQLSSSFQHGDIPEVKTER